MRSTASALPANPLRVYVLNQSMAASEELTRLLGSSGRVSIEGVSSQAQTAKNALATVPVDALFLDCELGELTGFQFLAQLSPLPAVVFTARDRSNAFEAFEAGAVDYLRTPVAEKRLAVSLDRLERVRQNNLLRARPEALLRQLTELLPKKPHLERLASRIGQKIELVELQSVTHFYAQDKLTYAATEGKQYPIDETMTQLEGRLDPQRFVRVHRAAIVCIECVREVLPWFAGRLLLRLGDQGHTELAVSRDRIRLVRERLGL